MTYPCRFWLMLSVAAAALNAGQLRLLSPQGGEKFYVGDTVHIRWWAQPNHEVVTTFELVDRSDWPTGPFTVADEGGVCHELGLKCLSVSSVDSAYGGFDWIASDTFYLQTVGQLSSSSIAICIYFFSHPDTLSCTAQPIIILPSSSEVLQEHVRYKSALLPGRFGACLCDIRGRSIGTGALGGARHSGVALVLPKGGGEVRRTVGIGQ